jgi:hypothetical protein
MAQENACKLNDQTNQDRKLFMNSSYLNIAFQNSYQLI